VTSPLEIAMRTLLLSSFLAFARLAALAQSAPQLDPAGPANPPPAIALDPGYAEQFRCPESFPDEDSRLAATERYLAWANRAHPDWRVDDTMNYRTTLLRANNCQATLDSEVGNQPHVAR
jgi:hypothetical protein